MKSENKEEIFQQIIPEEKRRKINQESMKITKKWSIYSVVRKNENYFFSNRKNLKEKLVNHIKEGIKCILFTGPRATGKTTTVFDIQNEFIDTLMI